MVVQEHFGVADGVFGAYEDEWNGALLAGHRGLGFIVAFDFDSDHT